MKKLAILMIIMIPMVATAQVDARATKTQYNKNEVAPKSYVYGDISVADMQGRTVIKLDFGTVIGSVYGDKEFRQDLTDLKAVQYSSLADALNTLSAYGWHVSGDYTEITRTGTEQHLIIRKEVTRVVKPELTSKGKETVKDGSNAARKRK